MADLKLPSAVLTHLKAGVGTAAEFDAGNTLLVVDQVIHGAQPQAQRQVSRGEDRAGDQRYLAAAGAALEQPAGFNRTTRPPAADGALKAIGSYTVVCWRQAR